MCGKPSLRIDQERLKNADLSLSEDSRKRRSCRRVRFSKVLRIVKSGLRVEGEQSGSERFGSL